MKTENPSLKVLPNGKLLPWIICGLAAVFYCYEYLLRIAPSAMESELMVAFEMSSAGVGYLSSMYFFAYTPMQLPVGLLMDQFGPRRILTFAVLLCAFGATMMGLGINLGFNVALLGRFLIGFGSAFAFVGVLKLASVWLPPDRFGLITGLTTTLGMIGAMIGQNMLSELVGTLGLSATLIYSCIIGFILVPVIWLVVRDEPKTAQSTVGPQVSFSKLLLDIKDVFTNKQVWVIGLVGALIILPTTVFAEMWGRLFIKTYYEYDPQLSARITSLIFLGWAVGGPIVGYISDSIKNRRLLIFMGSLIGAGMMAWLIYGSPMSLWGLYAFMFLFGVVSSVENLCFAVARENTKDAVAGTAIAMTNFIIVCGGFFQYVVGKALDLSRGSNVDIVGNPLYSVEDFQFSLIILPISMGLGFLLCFFVKETHCKVSD